MERQTTMRNEMINDRYHDFDQALLAQLRAGRRTMRELNTDASGLRELAWPLCTRGLLSRPVPPPRLIQERLVALQEQGVVRFDGRAWEVIRRA